MLGPWVFTLHQLIAVMVLEFCHHREQRN